MGAPAAPMLPRLRHIDPDVQRWADALVRAITTELAALRTPAGQSGYSVSNLTESRSLDPTTATLGQVAQALGTLITDAQKKGVVA